MCAFPIAIEIECLWKSHFIQKCIASAEWQTRAVIVKNNYIKTNDRLIISAEEPVQIMLRSFS